MRKIWLVTVWSLREAARRRALLIMAAGTLVVVALFWAGLNHAWGQITARPTPIPAASIAYIGARSILGFLSVLVAIAGVFVGAANISSEIESGSLHLLLPRTITRVQVYLGKLLAATILIGLFSLTLVAGVGLALAASGPGWPPGWHWVLGGFMLPPILLAAVALALSTRLATVPAGLLALLTYILAQIGSVVEMVAAQTQSKSLELWGIIASLLIPVDAVYRWVIAQWIGALGPAGASLQMAGGMTGPAPSDYMLYWALGWLVAVAALGAWSFRTRDL